MNNCLNKMDRMKVLSIVVAILNLFGTILADDMRCYVCSSYMEQCKEKVDTYKGYAHRGRCYSKCFIRLGEDGAIYRGCFDGFKEVPFLTSDYDGCKEQSWNGRTLPWCFCEGDLCNKVAMKDMGYKSDVNVGQGYTVNSQDTSQAEYVEEYGQAHYVDNMDNYVEQPSANNVYSLNSQSYQQEQQEKEKKDSGYGFDKGDVKVDYDSSQNAYAKEGYGDETGYEIKEVNHAADISKEQLKQLDTYMQDYYTQNGYQPVYYGGEYDRFHYYQVEDPNAYMEETSPEKYIAMDESEGFKVVIDTAENEVTDKEQQPIAKESTNNEPIVDNNNVANTQTGDVYSRNDNVYNSGVVDGQQSAYNEQSQRYQNQLYQSYQNEKQRYDSQKAELKDDFKTEGQTENEEEDPYYFPPHLAERIECAKTGFYQNPDDCRTFVACILDAHVRRPYMHMMRCPEGLVWDNHDKICNQFSTTCNVGGYMQGSYDRQMEYHQDQQAGYGSYQQQQPSYENSQQQQQLQQAGYSNRQLQQQFMKYAEEE